MQVIVVASVSDMIVLGRGFDGSADSPVLLMVTLPVMTGGLFI